MIQRLQTPTAASMMVGVDWDGIAAAGVFYYDLRSYMSFQQQVQTETVRVLNDLSLRLNAVERHLERLDKAGESTNYQPPGQGGATHTRRQERRTGD